MKWTKAFTMICFFASFSGMAAISNIDNVKVEVAGALKLKQEFSLTKLDPLYFLGGFKKVEVNELADKKIEIRVLFSNDLFSEDSLEDPEKALKKELSNLSSLPHEISASLNSKDATPTCLGERRPHSNTKVTSEFAFESVRTSLTAIAAFHMANLQTADLNKEELAAAFANVRRNIENTMDRIYGIEKKPNQITEALLKKYGIDKKDVDAREALLKSLNLLDEARAQLKTAEGKDKKISTRLSVEREGIAYVLTVEKT